MSSVSVGKKIYVTFGDNGIFTTTTRDEARGFAKEGKGIVVEAPVSSNQAKVIRKVLSILTPLTLS